MHIPQIPPRRQAVPIPKGLKGKARVFFQNVVKNFELEEFHVELLAQGCWALQRCEEARAIVDKAGMTYVDTKSGRCFPNPATTIEKDNRVIFTRIIRELGLDLADTQAARPPTRAGRKAR